MLVAVPSAVKVFNWAATLYKGSITFKAPMVYALCFLGLFVVGGCSGVFLGCLGTGIHFTETYFIVAHFHFVTVGAVLSFLVAKDDRPHVSGISCPHCGGNDFRRLLLHLRSTVHPGLSGCATTHWIVSGRVAGSERIFDGRSQRHGCWIFLHRPLFGLVAAVGKEGNCQPWNAAGLEWQTASPPITQNFPEIPVMDYEAYNYDEIDASLRVLAKCRFSSVGKKARADPNHFP